MVYLDYQQAVEVKVHHGAHLRNTRQRDLLLNELIDSRAELSNFLWREAMRPFLRSVLVVFCLPDCRASDLLGEILERTELVVDGRVLRLYQKCSFGV